MHLSWPTKWYHSWTVSKGPRVVLYMLILANEMVPRAWTVTGGDPWPVGHTSSGGTYFVSFLHFPRSMPSYDAHVDQLEGKCSWL